MNEWIAIQHLREIERFASITNRPIVLVLEAGEASFCGQVHEGIFGYRMGSGTPGIRAIVKDFCDYARAQGRTPLLFALGDVSLLGEIQERDGAPLANWVVHSTDQDAGASICNTRRLWSRNGLRSQGIAFRSFGRAVLGEPSDYSDLVNFAPVSVDGPEIVVASKEHGRFCSTDDLYHPGTRFYFKVSSLQTQSGYTRFMGGHAVRDSLWLDQVEHHLVSLAHLLERPSWTPRTFTKEANRRFAELISSNPETNE
jgi:hypothetical protein